MKNYYHLFEVQDYSNTKILSKAYRQLAKRYHPDRNPGDKTCEDKMKELNEAWEILSNRVMKEAYDAKLQAFLFSPVTEDFDLRKEATNYTRYYNTYNDKSTYNNAFEGLDEKTGAIIMILSWILVGIPGIICFLYFLTTGERQKMKDTLLATIIGAGGAALLIYIVSLFDS